MHSISDTLNIYHCVHNQKICVSMSKSDFRNTNVLRRVLLSKKKKRE